jgi:hypothetical protein
MGAPISNLQNYFKFQMQQNNDSKFKTVIFVSNVL